LRYQLKQNDSLVRLFFLRVTSCEEWLGLLQMIDGVECTDGSFVMKVPEAAVAAAEKCREVLQGYRVL